MAEILNTESALIMLGGETELLRELLAAFLQDRPLDQQELLRLVSQEDTEPAAQYVHYYKGAGRQIGAEQLGRAGQQLENVLRQKDTGNLSALLQNFIQAYNQTVDKVSRTLDQLM